MDGNRPRRTFLKSHHLNWKEKLRENCLKRVREERTQLLWKIRSTEQRTPSGKEINYAFRDIVSDELHKIKESTIHSCQGITASKDNDNDSIWEFDGLLVESNSGVSESEEMMLEIERLLYEDMREELTRRELEAYEEEDEYLARAVFEHMQLNDNQACNNDKVWCPVCKVGELREVHHQIYCTSCNLRLALEDEKLNLDFVRERLGDVHMEHLNRGCKATPKFCTEAMFGLTALYIKCEVCGTFEVVV